MADRAVHSHDLYTVSDDGNGTGEDRGLSQQSTAAMNLSENMTAPALCSMPELDVGDSRSPVPAVVDCNAKHVVKSLLRAMLAKPRPGDMPALMELTQTVRSEFDSGSDDTGEPPQSAAVDAVDDDSQSAMDTVPATVAAARDDNIKSDTDLTATDLTASTTHTWASSPAVPSPEKASRCPYCLKMFRYRSSYRRHVKIHEGIFSHECTVCMRKFTRKEHYVRHKCDRRPNKPYNVTHEAFRRMSAVDKLAMRHIMKSDLMTDALGHPAAALAGRFDSGAQLDVPLELTCQSTGKQLDVPTLLFTGGSMSSMSLDGSTQSVCPPLTIPPGSAVSSTAVDVGCSEDVSLRDVSCHATESRRKSSKPRKVIPTSPDPNRTIEWDNCRHNFSAKLNGLGSVPVSVID